MIRTRLGLCSAMALIVAPAALADDCETPIWDEDVADYVDGDNIITGQLCFPACPPGLQWEAWESDPLGEGANADAAFGDGPKGGMNGLSIKLWGGRPTGSDDLVHTYHDLELTSGLWAYGTDVYIPAGSTGEMFFALLNEYTNDGKFETENWSTQVRINGVDGILQSDFDGGTIPIQFDVWRRLETIINFDEDLQAIRYDGVIFNRPGKTWTGGVSGGGSLALAALNLFGNGADPVYFDGFDICPIAPLGACCFAREPCLEDMSREECEALQCDAEFQGVGSNCGSSCFFYGPNGWEVSNLLVSAPPFRWGGNTCTDYPGGTECNLGGEGKEADDCVINPMLCSECDLSDAQDQAWSFRIPWDGTWTFSTCGAANFDTVIYASTEATCMFDDPEKEWSNDNCERLEFELDSELSVPIERGVDDVGDVFVTLEGFMPEDCGSYILSVGAPCPPLDLGPDMELMGPCEMDVQDAENVGCNADPEKMEIPTFTDIACGETFSGTVGNYFFGNEHRRDLDWFRLEIPETMTVTLDAVGNYPEVVVFLAELNPDFGEKEDECTDAAGILFDGATASCVDLNGERTRVRIQRVVPPGLYSPIISTDFVFPTVPASLGGVPCADKEQSVGAYELTILCGPACDPKSGDNDGDGCVGFSDVLAVLAGWNQGGAPGIPGDSNCDGEIGFADILLILATWGQGCP